MLVVEGYPRWEYRYLRNALLARPGGRAVVPALSPRADRSPAAATRITSRRFRPDATSCRNLTSSFWVTSAWTTAS